METNNGEEELHRISEQKQREEAFDEVVKD